MLYKPSSVQRPIAKATSLYHKAISYKLSCLPANFECDTSTKMNISVSNIWHFKCYRCRLSAGRICHIRSGRWAFICGFLSLSRTANKSRDNLYIYFIFVPYCLSGVSYYAVLLSEWVSGCNNRIRALNELCRLRSDVPGSLKLPRRRNFLQSVFYRNVA